MTGLRLSVNQDALPTWHVMVALQDMLNLGLL